MFLMDNNEEKEAIINAKDIHEPIANFPEKFVLFWSEKILNEIENQWDLKTIGHFNTVSGATTIYQYGSIGIFKLTTGAPISISALEVLIGYGMKSFCVFGTCGVLDAAIDKKMLIVPSAALKDEGTSYHYISEGDEVSLSAKRIKKLTDYFKMKNIEYIIGKTWSTDAFYRETKAKMKAAKDRGAIAVDMEMSAILALAKFRLVKAYPFLHAEDNLDSTLWKPRGMHDKKSDDLLNYFRIAYDFMEKNG